MKKIFLISMLILACVVLTADEMPWLKYDNLKLGSEKSLDIMTWNIQKFPKHKFAVELAANTIMAIDADVIGLQEIKSAKHFEQVIKILQTEDPEDGWQGYRANTSVCNLNLAFVYKSAILSQINIYEIYADDEKYHSPFPRKPLVMEFTYANEDYVVINNHLKAKAGKKNEKRRKRAMQLLKEYVDRNLADEEVFVLGDLNDNLVDAPKDNVFSGILNDPENYQFVDIKIANDSMSDWSYPYWEYRSHLDHIIITNELFDEFETNGSEIRVIPLAKFMKGGDDARYKYLTDHRPVFLKLMIK